MKRARRYTTIQLDIIHTGDCLEILKTLPGDSIHCCVTSPPYYALRDYGMEAQIGRETTPKEYADTEYKITELGITRTLALKRNQVILDESFILSGNVQRLCAKRRFTLAHECAHQILFQLESEEVKASCEMRYSARTAYTPRELKTREDWNEWQANVLGAAILLPQKEVDLAMRRFAETPLINYEGRYSYAERLSRCDEH